MLFQGNHPNNYNGQFFYLSGKGIECLKLYLLGTLDVQDQACYERLARNSDSILSNKASYY